MDNPWLWAAIGLGIAAQIAVVHLPVLQIAFATSPLSLSQWITCADVAFLVLWAQGVAKVIRRLHSRFCTHEAVR
ncbi:cation transporting ATPase C-terminal domain-containing protein [Schaalia cardiffensis]|uniref:cation transporting ATPase C-terminal domain-containing protein n=1 Tax=Schaalia cardiffensis TaxID=181487 RepID=UPI003C70548A